VTTLNEYVAE